jgi:hypothetical protein
MRRVNCLSRSCFRVAAAVLALLPTLASAVDDYTGAWWRPDESGWGLYLVDQGNLLVPSWFTYGDDGKATWYIMSGAIKQADGSYAGDVYSFTGVPYAQINGQASDPGTRVGTATFRFPDFNSLTFDYTVSGHQQSKSLTRFDWGNEDLVCSPSTAPISGFTNYTAMWWDPTQSGWGLQINHVGSMAVATWYTYGSDRKPIWLQAVTTREGDGVFRGKIYQGATGTPYHLINGQPATTSTPEVGTATLSFANGGSGQFSYVIGSVSQTKTISRAEYGNAVSQCRTVTTTTPPPGAGTDECFPPLALGNRTVIRDVGETTGTEQRVAGTSIFNGHPVFVLEDRPTDGSTQGVTKEYVEQTATHRIYHGGEGYIPEVQANGTFEYIPPVEIPRSTPVGYTDTLDYVIRARYTAQGVAVTADINVHEVPKRIGTENASAPAGSFSNACKFDTTLKIESSVSAAGFTVRTVTDGRAIQWAHSSVGPVRSEYETTTTVTTTGGFAVPPQVTQDQGISELIEATINGRNYP